jgi:translation elongation factor EF-Tu-like GTPase
MTDPISIESMNKAFEVLGCSHDDSLETIKMRYRKLVKIFHPDTLRGETLHTEVTELVAAKFREIQDAYELIINYRNAPHSGTESEDCTFSLFEFQIEDIFNLGSAGTVVTGRVSKGEIRVGQSVKLERSTGSPRSVIVAKIEMFRKFLQQASVGDNVGLYLDNVKKREISRGDWLKLEAL